VRPCLRFIHWENAVSGYILKRLHNAARPANLYGLRHGAGSEPEVSPWIARR